MPVTMFTFRLLSAPEPLACDERIWVYPALGLVQIQSLGDQVWARKMLTAAGVVFGEGIEAEVADRTISDYLPKQEKTDNNQEQRDE
ncbi:MAG: hypothetical protein V7739_20115 [Motiliproteus sp.]